MLYPLEAVNDHRNILEPVHGVLPPYSYISATDTANPTQAPPNHTDTQASEEHLYLLLDGWREDEPLCLAISRHLEPVPNTSRDAPFAQRVLQRSLYSEPAAVHRQHVRRCGP